MRILITGARGFVGHHLINLLQTKTDAIVIKALRGGAGGKNSRNFDLLEPEQWSKDLLTNIDVVVHLAAFVHKKVKNDNSLKILNSTNVNGSRELIDRCIQAGVKRFVFLSSIGVNGRCNNAHAINEESPLSPNSPYAESKLAIENYLRNPAVSSSLESVVIRPPMVYGDSAPGNLKLLKRLVSSGVPLPFAEIRNEKSFISVENLAEVLLLCIYHPNAANEIFTVADDERVSTEDLVRSLANTAHSQARLFQLPISFIRSTLSVIGQGRLYSQLFESLTVDNRKAKALLGWQPKASSFTDN